MNHVLLSKGPQASLRMFHTDVNFVKIQWTHLSQKLPFLGTWYAFRFSFSKKKICPLSCSLERVPRKKHRKRTSSRGMRDLGPGAPVVPAGTWAAEHVLPLLGVARWKHSCFPDVPGSAWLATRGLQSLLMLLFISHMIHIVWGFNPRSPREHFWFRSHLSSSPSTPVLQVSTWQLVGCWGLEDERNRVLAFGNLEPFSQNQIHNLAYFSNFSS